MDLTEVTDNTNRHPWELSRERCMLREIRRLDRVERVLDVGCGDGYFDRQLVSHDERVKSLVGYDLYLQEPASEGVCSWTNDFAEVPDGAFDLILMMDVLEHVEKDDVFFRQVCRKLGPGGRILITVPAFMKLYSRHDEVLKHFRRYDRKMLTSVVSAADCVILDVSYFYASLVPLRLLTRNREETLGTWKYGRRHFATALVERALNADYDALRLLSKAHIFPGGLSLLMIVRKRENEQEQNA